ncbi:MAG: glutamate--tRNA ligase [Gammaproteobacteria bacterium]|nr:glutamate--tRNA ligase [Gammaproteobacteria bacterium]
MNSLTKTRFAPSPTGLLHLGNIRTALFNYLLAKHAGGIYLLRIEDTDAMRGQEKYTAALMEDMRWLGLMWDEGPEAGGTLGPYEQSQRGAVYATYFAQLADRKLAYPCFCSEHELKVERKTQIAASKPPRYSGKCRGLAAAEVEQRRASGLPATLRFHVPDGRTIEFDDGVHGPQSFKTDDIGDFVIRRSDGTPAFFFCNAVDDALMNVTLAVRGEDHLTNTPRQVLLLEALGLPVPRYAHIALVMGNDGAPLSKRTGSKSVQELRAGGFLPLAINNYLARLGHTFESNAFLSLAELAQHFDLARLHKSPARYDEAQLLHWQREAVLHLPADDIWTWMDASVHALVPADRRQAFIDCVRGNLLFAADALHWAQILFGQDFTPTHAARDAMQAAGESFYAQAAAALVTHGAEFKGLSESLKQASGRSGKALFQPLRAALTGELDGPEMAKLLPLLGVDRARQRFARAGQQLN